MRPKLLLLFFLILLSFASPLSSGISAAPAGPFGVLGNGAKDDAKEADSPDSPRFMMRQVLDMMEREDLDAALKFVELPRGLSLEQRRDKVRQLFDVLNRRGDIDVATLSNLPKGKPTDSPYTDLEIIGYVRVVGESIPIELHLVTDKNGSIWKFSQDFMEKVPDLASGLRRNALMNHIPEDLRGREFLGVKVWQMIAIVVVVLIAYLASLILAWLMSGGLRLLTRKFKLPIPETSFQGFVTPLRLFAGLLVFTVLLVLFEIDLRFRLRLAYVETIGMTIALVLFATRLTAAIIEMSRQSQLKQGKLSATTMLMPIQRGINVLFVILGILFLLKSLGFDVTTIIAGLGIGGIAIALASQKTIENLFGGISVIMDQPVRVGDYGKFGQIQGTVEDIGLRSTKVRTLDRTIVTIPNGEFSQLVIENFERRDKIRWATVLALRPETTAEQMRLVLMKIKELLLAHTMVYNEPARVRFVGFGATGLNVDIFAYVRCSDYSDYLAVLEDLNLRLMDIFQEVGTGIALSSQAVYNFPGDRLPNLDPSVSVHLVQKQVTDGGFPQPHYPPQWADPRTDTIPFPAKPESVS